MSDLNEYLAEKRAAQRAWGAAIDAGHVQAGTLKAHVRAEGAQRSAATAHSRVGIVRRRDQCRGAIVNLGLPGNDVSIRELAEQMAAVYRSLEARRSRSKTCRASSSMGPATKTPF